jgi:hypothetical protein
MKIPPTRLALAFALLCTVASLGQESAPPAPAARPPAPSAASPPAAGQQPEGAETPPAQRPEVDDDEFIPTEELAPDAAVTFPVDI